MSSGRSRAAYYAEYERRPEVRARRKAKRDLRRGPRRGAPGCAKNQAVVDALKAEPCTDCGRTFPPCAMDFDHVGEKLFNIATGIRTVSTQRLLAEIAKCELVCACCHRIRTWQRHQARLSRIVRDTTTREGSTKPGGDAPGTE